ncbi:hypothetical protein BC835DRAFT_348307 [Cytidiella melzeri]|nr:hypothetical protein BC835DRAFT_348307 [Cytidiella melzeri]
MSHLPPRPAYSYPPPPKFDSRKDPHARPLPDNAYSPREREVYPPRSPPPRSRYSSDRDRQSDAYLGPPDPYMSRDPYTPHSRYDRREDDKYRAAHYDRERRERDYPLFPIFEYRPRYREDRRDDPRPLLDTRARRDDDPRAGSRGDDHGRRLARRPGPPESARDWALLRLSATPPPPPYTTRLARRPGPSPPPSRPRSPPPRRHARSPEQYSRSPRVSTRSVSPTKSRPSVHPNPRYRDREDERYSTRTDDRGSSRRRSRSRTHSPVRTSPSRSARSPRRVYSRSRSPVRRRDRSRSSDRRRIDSRGRSPIPPTPPSEAKTQVDKNFVRELLKQPEQVHVKPETLVKPAVNAESTARGVVEESKPETQKNMEKAPERPTVDLVEKVEVKPKPSIPAVVSTSTEEPLWKPKDATQLDKDGISLVEKQGILLPDSYWQHISGGTSIAVPTQTESQKLLEIQRDPVYQAMQDLAAQYTPMSIDLFLEPSPKDMGDIAKAILDTGEEDEDLKKFDISASDAWHHHPSTDVEYFFKQVNGKVDPLFQRRAHLESERDKLWCESNQALLDLKTVVLDVKAAEIRRKIAEAQLELAMEGRLGIEYDHSKPSIADSLEPPSMVDVRWDASSNLFPPLYGEAPR